MLDLIQVFWRVFNTVDAELPGAAAAPEVIAGWHRTILDTVCRGDEQALRAAIAEHFRGIRARLPMAHAG